jgi:aminomethyltransferase
VPNKVILEFMDKLLKIQNPETKVQIAEMIGLGARDSLRLEAGLCLYGHDINETISPIEAMLAWTISKRRKEEGGYLGSDIVKEHIEKGVSKKRCGFVAEGKLPVREGAEIFNKGTKVGVVTSGGPAPCLNNTGIGMAYVESPFNKVKTELTAVVRGKEIPIKVHKMPFVPNRYYKPE